MDSIEGDYGVVNLLEPHIVELIANRGVEVTPLVVEACYDAAIELCGGYCAFLINRLNDYSVTYAANQRIADDRRLIALAYLTHSDSSARIAEYNVKLARQARCPIEVFRQRESAISWLRQHIMEYGNSQQAAR